MKYNRAEKENILVHIDIYEIIQLSKLIEESTCTKENMKMLHDLDQVMFAYYRELDKGSQ